MLFRGFGSWLRLFIIYPDRINVKSTIREKFTLILSLLRVLRLLRLLWLLMAWLLLLLLAARIAITTSPKGWSNGGSPIALRKIRGMIRDDDTYDDLLASDGVERSCSIGLINDQIRTIIS